MITGQRSIRLDTAVSLVKFEAVHSQYPHPALARFCFLDQVNAPEEACPLGLLARVQVYV